MNAPASSSAASPSAASAHLVALHAQRALERPARSPRRPRRRARVDLGCTRSSRGQRTAAAFAQDEGRSASKRSAPPMPTAAKPRKNARQPRAEGQARPKRARAARARSVPQLEQRHLDLLGLGLVALAVFLGFVLYRDRDGGAGRASSVVDGLRGCVGDVAYARAAGAGGDRRDPRAAPGPARRAPVPLGRLCLFLAAGAVAGRAPTAASVGELLEEHVGGLLGDARRRRPRRSSSSSPRVLLLTGASVAGVLQATSDSVADTTRALRTVARAPARRARAAPAPVVAARARGRGAVDVPTNRRACSTPSRGALPEPDDEPALEPEPEPEPEPLEPTGRGRARRRAEPRPRSRPPRAHVDVGPRTSRRRAACARSSPTTRSSSGSMPRADAAQALDAPSRRGPTPPARSETARTSSRRSATSASRRRSSARSPARTSPATSCASRPASR